MTNQEYGVAKFDHFGHDEQPAPIARLWVSVQVEWLAVWAYESVLTNRLYKLRQKMSNRYATEERNPKVPNHKDSVHNWVIKRRKMAHQLATKEDEEQVDEGDLC